MKVLKLLKVQSSSAEKFHLRKTCKPHEPQQNIRTCKHMKFLAESRAGTRDSHSRGRFRPADYVLPGSFWQIDFVLVLLLEICRLPIRLSGLKNVYIRELWLCESRFGFARGHKALFPKRALRSGLHKSYSRLYLDQRSSSCPCCSDHAAYTAWYALLCPWCFPSALAPSRKSTQGA